MAPCITITRSKRGYGAKPLLGSRVSMLVGVLIHPASDMAR